MAEPQQNLSPMAQQALDGTDALFEPDAYTRIKFQLGPIQEHGVNGTTIEAVIDLLVARLEGFQAGPFRCRTNALAITKLEEARMWLQERTRQRIEQGVEGKNIVHTESA